MAFLKYEWVPEGKEFEFMFGEEKIKLSNSFPNGVLELNWNDADMIEAYCGDLEGGITSDDMLDACNWITKYKLKTGKN